MNKKIVQVIVCDRDGIKEKLLITKEEYLNLPLKWTNPFTGNEHTYRKHDIGNNKFVYITPGKD
jgi:hypothetical protein